MESSSGRRKTVLLSLLVFLFSILAFSIFESSLSSVQRTRIVSHSGGVKGVGVDVYWDPACTNVTTSINWGLLEPGSNKTMTVYIKNRGNSLAALSMATQNWNPSTAPTYMTLNWDYAGQTLGINQVIQTKLTLTISSTASEITNFNFDTMIVATG